MPLITPNKGEEQDSFISRCMSNDAMKKEFPDNKQRNAVCFSQFKKGKKEDTQASPSGPPAPLPSGVSKPKDTTTYEGRSTEDKKKFMNACMSSEFMKSRFPEDEARQAACTLNWIEFEKSAFISNVRTIPHGPGVVGEVSDSPPSGTTRGKFSKIGGYEIKEDDGNLLVKGYIATTHLDSGFPDTEKGTYIRDKISKDALIKWAEEINSGNPRANKVSVHHDREPHVTGVGIRGTARVDELPDGEYGLYVETLVDKTKDGFTDTKYKIDNGLLDSFSIEFTTKDPLTNTYYENAAVEETVGEGIVRTLLPGTQLEGWTLASQPMNEFAMMVKEVLGTMKCSAKEMPKSINSKNREDKTMAEEEKKPEEPKKEEKAPEEPAPAKEEDKEKKKDDEEEDPEDEDPEDEEDVKKKKKKKMEMLNKETIAIIEKEVKTRVSAAMSNAPVEDKVMKSKEEPVETKEVLEYKEIFKKDSHISLSEQFKRASRLAEQKGILYGGGWKQSTKAEYREFKSFATNGCKLEFKGLGLTTNQNTDTDYLLSAAELSDVFDPVIYNALNQATVTWNIMPKDDLSMKGNNQVQFTLKTAANTTAGAYTGNAVATGNVTRLKYMTKFKKYQVGVEVDGDMVAAARGGPIGDVFAKEVQDSTDDLMSNMNADLFKENGAESDAEVIGFEYVADSAGNTTLYNVTRSAANKLNPDAAANTYINGASANITLTNLRAAKRQCLKDGSKIENLVFVCDHVQGDKFRGIFDAAQRTVPTSSRFGFEGRPEFDGIPIFEDKDCNDDDWFLLDLESARIAIWVPPTLEMLGKDSDSEKGFIKAYWATYYRAPRRLCMIYSNAT